MNNAVRSSMRGRKKVIPIQINPVISKYSMNEEQRYPCKQCNRSYKNKRHLYRHVQVECGKEPKFQCPYCPYRGKYRDHLNKHMAALHMDSVYTT